jgi:hypothetical protein
VMLNEHDFYHKVSFRMKRKTHFLMKRNFFKRGHWWAEMTMVFNFDGVTLILT